MINDDNNLNEEFLADEEVYDQEEKSSDDHKSDPADCKEESAEKAAGDDQAGQEDNASDEEAKATDNETAEALKKLEELQTAYLRLQADFDNFRKRTKTEKDNTYKYALEDIMKQLLPVLDNFERALETKTDNCMDFAAGIELIYKQLWSVLENNGLKLIEAFEQPFDPNMHNAVLSEENDKYPLNTVSQELQKGYTLNDRVIRASMVKVTV